MLPCFWKQLLNMDCLGCGMQRAFVLLCKGQFTDAFKMYPAIYSTILLFIILAIHLKYKLKQGHNLLLGLFILNIIITITNYIYKHLI